MARDQYTYDYPRPMVSVDAVVFRRAPDEIDVLVIQRKKPPFAGMPALPGGFVKMDEDLIVAAQRELREETGLSGVDLDQLGAFGRPDRDPRGRNITIAFVGITKTPGAEVRGGDDASDALWVPARRPPKLAFDHDEILLSALEWLKSRL